MMINKKQRSTLIGVTGGYLCYLAWQLFQDRAAPDTTMAPWVTILFSILFLLGGAVLMVYAIRLWRQSLKEEDDQKQDQEKDALK